jgi:hypothetical protein
MFVDKDCVKQGRFCVKCSHAYAILRFKGQWVMNVEYNNQSYEINNLTDISELNLPKTTSISFPNGKDDLMNFEVTIRPDEGYYV